MQTAGMLAPHLSDIKVVTAANREGVRTMPLSIFQLHRTVINGLLLGFGGYRPERIRESAAKLAHVLERMKRDSF